MLLDAEDSQLVLLDYQQRLLPALHAHEDALANAVRLARFAQLLDVPCCLTEQNPQGLGPSAPALRTLVPTVLAKTDFSAAATLAPRLRPQARPPAGNARSLPRHLQKPAQPPAPARGSILLAGCEAHVCVLQTALELLDEEWEVWVVTDACASRSERDRDAAFDRLAGAGCELVTTEMVAFEWLRGCGHPHFKDVLALVKEKP